MEASHCFTVSFVHCATGESIHLPRVSTRVREHTSLEWFLPYIAEAVEWPVSHIRMHALGATVQYVHRIPDRTCTLIQSLAELQGKSANETIVVNVEKLPPPSWYNDSLWCICDFGGCCRLCHVPGNGVCGGCGNNACCRCGNCGHTCCARRVRSDKIMRLCDRQGCQPWWASDLSR